jgi:secreted trypsin-like serine protease
VLHYLPNPLFGVNEFFDKDMMLLILNETSSNAYIKLNRDDKVPSDGQSLLTIGLGATNSTLAGPFPTVLQKIEVKAIPNIECARATDGNFSYQDYLTDNMVCALHPNAGPCYEDSGGPLLVEGDDASQDILIGTVSWYVLGHVLLSSEINDN